MGFLPKDARFFELMTEHGALLIRATALLRESFAVDPPDWPAVCSRLSEVETEGDRITRETIRRLNDSFITPFDPEDIYRLVNGLERVLDGLESLAQRLRIYDVGQIPEPMKSIAGLLEGSAAECLAALRSLSQGNDLAPQTRSIREIESQVDTIYRDSLYALFRTEKDPIRLWTLKEIYERLETAADRFQDVSFVLEEIQLKNS
jgi:predicted phosphate transport protein (TIGR00153 family)